MLWFRRRKPLREVTARYPGGSALATFFVRQGDDGEVVESWAEHAGPHGLAQDIEVEQALGELELSLGLRPSLQYSEARAGRFVWDPPLQRTD